MAQLSIFEKQRHFSDKDLTISVGKYDTIYITFRHDSWKRFTDFDYIAVAIRDNVLIFGDPYEKISWVHFKLKQTHGNPETYEYTRYVQISGKAWPEFLKAARNMVGSFNFDDVPTIKNVSEEDIEKLKELLANAGPTKLEPLEDIVPTGFILVHDQTDDLRIALRVSTIYEVLENCQDTVIRFNNTESNSQQLAVNESFDEVMQQIRKAHDVILESVRMASEV